ncbi:MAG: 16S rRNA (guanine(966)-N(2))-methyltransferase RsmD [Hyphomicrobiaceae bacterium]
MRIVGGDWRGRPLTAPKSENIRPTSDRVREAIFNILAHDQEIPSLEEARVIDVFAGSGALGLEALSRGARFCLFVEQSAQARGLIRSNIEAMRAQGISKLYRRDATGLGPITAMAPFNVAFLDPPYGQQLGERALSSLSSGNWLTTDAIIVLEERAKSDVALPSQFQQLDHRTYGDTQVVFARHQPSAPLAKASST